MSDEKALVPVEQKTVEFYEDQVTAVRMASGDVFIPLRPIVEGLGLDWASQTRRINRDPILSEESKVCVVVTTTQGHQDQPDQTDSEDDGYDGYKVVQGQRLELDMVVDYATDAA